MRGGGGGGEVTNEDVESLKECTNVLQGHD